MPKVGDFEAVLAEWAPKELAASWDNVGLLVGSAEAEVQRCLIALDLTEAVAAEAIVSHAELILTHHPVMNCTWKPVQSVTTETAQGRILMGLLSHGISAICMHTNLDAAEGGVNDCLAEALGLAETEPLGEDGIGRVGTLAEPCSLPDFLRLVKTALSCGGLRYRDAGLPVRRVAVGGGACGSYIARAKELACDTFVTADLNYHAFLDAPELNLIDAGHFPTENGICSVILRRMQAHFPTVELQISAVHEDVIHFF